MVVCQDAEGLYQEPLLLNLLVRAAGSTAAMGYLQATCWTPAVTTSTCAGRYTLHAAHPAAAVTVLTQAINHSCTNT